MTSTVRSAPTASRPAIRLDPVVYPPPLRRRPSVCCSEKPGWATNMQVQARQHGLGERRFASDSNCAPSRPMRSPDPIKPNTPPGHWRTDRTRHLHHSRGFVPAATPATLRNCLRAVARHTTVANLGCRSGAGSRWSTRRRRAAAPGHIHSASAAAIAATVAGLALTRSGRNMCVRHGYRVRCCLGSPARARVPLVH